MEKFDPLSVINFKVHKSRKNAPLIPSVDFKRTRIQTQAPLVKLMQKRAAWAMYNVVCVEVDNQNI